MDILEVKNLCVSYGLSQVLFEVSITASKGQLISLIGRNGVGKSTTLRSIMGLTPPHSGTVSWKGKDITRRSPNQNANDGLGFVPEDRRIFSNLTVWENLDIARKVTPSTKNQWNEERVFEFFPDLLKFRSCKGGILSGGEQQMLTIARTLMGNPELLLLDEPSEGLAPLIIANIRKKIIQLKDAGITIVLAEQNLELVLSISDKIYILEKGQVTFSGSAYELDCNKSLQEHYLGI